jgi:hypothetical protein
VTLHQLPSVAQKAMLTSFPQEITIHDTHDVLFLCSGLFNVDWMLAVLEADHLFNTQIHS